jgi:hypothetical protein
VARNHCGRAVGEILLVLDYWQVALENAAMDTISDVIRNAVLSAEVSRYSIAASTGIEESALSRFVNRKRGLSMEALDTLAEYFGYQIVKKKGR